MDKFTQFTDEEITLEFFKRWGFSYETKECFDDETGKVIERYYTIDPEPFDANGNLVEGTIITFGFSETEEYQGCLL